jgi:Ca2+-binding RTX toxin-like protein
MADVTGTPDDDSLVGDILNDRIFGGAGNDTLDGLSSLDLILSV